MRYNVSGLDMKGLKLAFVEHFFINIILFEFCKKKKIFPKCFDFVVNKDLFINTRSFVHRSGYRAVNEIDYIATK